jgi:signal transduction histidine kinase/FixJ family two-component response regulator
MSSTPLAPRNLRRALILSVAALGVGLVSVFGLLYSEMNGYRARAEAGESAPGPGPEHGSFAALLFAAGALCVASVVVVARLASHSIAQPLEHLVDIASDVTHGRARRRASPALAGGLRELAEAFNRMLDAQQQAEERFRLAHDSLELKVSARTAELFKANKALKDQVEQRERVEKDFYQAQKMDALGKLAGSIAHDFNNLLTVIIGGAESVQRQLGPNHATATLLQTVQQAAERAAGLTRPLLTFSRNQVLTVEQVHLNDAVEEAARMMHRLLGVNVELRLDLAKELPGLRTNPNQLQQVLVNLGVNARDAMDGIGTLYITTRLAARPAAAPHGPNERDRPWVELVVRDTGCGMDAATKARIFEPFFTTKPVGKGTGLGLATVFGIVKQGGGILEVESSPGNGTAFRIFWPGMTADECAATPATPVIVAAPPSQLAQGSKTVLLVDDESDIRELAALTLEEHGYRVLTACDAEEALLLGEKHGREIDALITDVVMPGISGVQLAQLLSKMLPDLRILFVSGHSNESISGETLLATSSSYLQKPYRGHALIAKVGEVLATSSADRRAERTMETSLFRRASVEHVAGPFDDLQIVG